MITLTGNALTLTDVFHVLYYFERVQATKDSLEKVKVSRQVVEKIVKNNHVVYGITTGFGKMSDVWIEPSKVEALQLNLIRSHACGVGEPFPESVARVMLLLRINALLKGYSGVRIELITLLIDCLNKRIHPVVPQQGSLGASGDLAPLSHLSLILIGEGEVFYRGERLPVMDVFLKEHLKPITLSAKEGLALINGTQAMTAMGIVCYLEAEKLAYQSEVIAAMTFEGLRGIRNAFNEAIHIARGYPEQIGVAQRFRLYIKKSRLTTRQGELRVQDAYSLRCIPQVHGASWQVLNYVKEKLEIEMNAATDNPLIFDFGEEVISGGNFHGQPIAFAMDFLKIAVAELASISERRVERVVNPQLSGLAPFLSADPGVESGAMILQYTAASLVSENKTLAHPASVDSIPSSANQEDHVSMGTIGARQAYQILENTRRVIAIEWFCAMQAVECHGSSLMAPRTRKVHRYGRKLAASITGDRIFSIDIERLAENLKVADWTDMVIQQ